MAFFQQNVSIFDGLWAFFINVVIDHTMSDNSIHLFNLLSSSIIASINHYNQCNKDKEIEKETGGAIKTLFLDLLITK